MEPIYSLLENSVHNLLLSELKNSTISQLKKGPDFRIEYPDGDNTFIEVKSGKLSRDSINKIEKLIPIIDSRIDKFLLVTPEIPPKNVAQYFKNLFSKYTFVTKWIDINSLPEEIGVESPGDFFSIKTLEDLQLNSFIGNIDRYKTAPIGVNFLGYPQDKLKEIAILTRQFSHSTILNISDSDKRLENVLGFGKRTPSITVVLSDLKNFSTLVKASNEENLVSSMDKYYRLSRDAVFKYGGVLDKFVGDSVVAIFGYPMQGADDSVKAIQLSQDLIKIGNEVLGEWLNNINAVIDIGTRIGIATGEIWPINIGTSEIELSFLGDVLNLAARLEKNCVVDHYLMDNITKTKATKENSKFVKQLNLSSVQIDPEDAKGQNLPIRCWTSNVL